MPIPLYSPLIGNVEAQVTDFRTSLAASTTDLGGGNSPTGKVGLDINVAGNSASLVTKPYDYISLSNYTTDNQVQTVVFKSGGATGTIVRTLTLAYANGSSGGNLTSVTAS